MAQSISINVGSAVEGADLARSLQRHGLIAALGHTGAQWQVEISSPREDPRTFLADIGVALAAWNGKGLDGVHARNDGRVVS